MSKIEEILQSKVKPKEKQTKLVEAVCKKNISAKEFIAFFESAADVDKGTCADVMKHISALNPEILAPYIQALTQYINYGLPRVKWGVPEAIGNMSKDYPEQTAKAIPGYQMVRRFCSRKQLLPIFEKIIKSEKNNGVKNVYTKE